MKEWAAFLLAGLFWGSSYIWIKIALEEVGPLTLVAFRLLFAVLGLLVVVLVSRHKIPRHWPTIGRIMVLSLLSPAIPFMLISWGELRIDSSVAAILNGALPLFTILGARFFLADELLSPAKILGLCSGFLGVLVLFGRDIAGTGLKHSASGFWGELAVLLAVMIYASSTIYTRRYLKKVSPITLSAGIMIFADGFAWLAVLGFERPLVLPHHALTWFALVWMGLLGSCAAFLFYFHLLSVWGVTRSALINYLTPMVGLILGLVFGNERADWHLIGGTALILSGILIVNFRALGLERVARAWKN